MKQMNMYIQLHLAIPDIACRCKTCSVSCI